MKDCVSAKQGLSLRSEQELRSNTKNFSFVTNIETNYSHNKKRGPKAPFLSFKMSGDN